MWGSVGAFHFTSEVGAGSDVIPERYVGFSAYEHDACSQLEIGQRGCVED